jgi:hypothetical protein
VGVRILFEGRCPPSLLGALIDSIESPFLCSSGLKFEERTQKMNVAKREKAMVNYFLYDGSTPPESSLRWRGVSWSERTLGCDFFGPTANLLICCS